jgi:hypothetical protein
MPQDTRTTALQEQVLNSIRKSQDATLDAVRAWAETIATVTPNMFQFFGIPNQENVFSFTEKLLASQRDFVSGLFEAAVTAGQAAPEAARQATASAGRAASSAENARPAPAKA